MSKPGRKIKGSKHRGEVFNPIKKDAGNAKKTGMYLSFLTGAIAFLLYANTINHGYVLDDYSVIKENWVVKQGLQGIPTLLKTSYRYGYWNDVGTLYRPLPLVLFAAEYHYFPDNPAIHHFLNVVLYALTGFFLTMVLLKLLPRLHPFIPFAASLLFISHPVHTEVVANIKSRDEILCFLLIILSVSRLFDYYENKNRAALIGSLVFYILAFFSKENAIVYLAVFPMLLWFFTDMNLRKIISVSSLYIIPAAAYLVSRRAVLGKMAAAEAVDVVDNLLVAAPDLSQRLATAVNILGKYFMLLVYPHPLACDYSYNQIPITGWDNISVWLSFLLYASLAAFALVRFMKKDLISFAILFFLATFSLYSNILILIGSSFGERFLYHSSLGFCFGLVLLLSRVMMLPAPGPAGLTISKAIPYNQLIFLPVLLIFCGYSLKTISRNRDWKSNYTLYEKDVVTSSNSARTHYYYALELVQSKALKTSNEQEKVKYLDMAIAEFTRATEIYPPYPDAYDQRGLAWYRKGDLNKALESYELALKYNPRKATTLSNMGAIYFNQGNYQKALDCYQRSVQAHPRYADAWWNLGSTYATLGNFQEAIKSYHESLKFDKENAMVYYFLGITYEKTGDKANAAKYLDMAYRMKPELRNNK